MASVYVDSDPRVETQLANKLYIQEKIDECSLLRLDPNEKQANDYPILDPNITTGRTIIDIPTVHVASAIKPRQMKPNITLGQRFLVCGLWLRIELGQRSNSAYVWLSSYV